MIVEFQDVRHSAAVQDATNLEFPLLNVLIVHRAVTGWETRWRPFPAGRRVSKSSWWRRDGRVAGRINHTAEIETEDEGMLILEYRLNGEPKRQVFDLVGQPCRFGGRR